MLKPFLATLKSLIWQLLFFGLVVLVSEWLVYAIIRAMIGVGDA